MFGFSQGAFTVRSLSGLIRISGKLKKENTDQAERALKIYRSRKAGLQPRAIEATLFRKTFAVEESTTIKFIGVWVTVGSLGNPLWLKSFLSRKNQFHDTGLSSKVNYAYHALAFDEKRKNFEATLWHQNQNATGQVLEQVWFPGVHSDIGGSYPDSGLSDISLEWMIGKAENCNLNFGKIEINPDSLAVKHESYTGFYTLQKKLFRPIGLISPDEGNTNETIHPSVIKRFKADNNYRPKNLDDYLTSHPEFLKGS